MTTQTDQLILRPNSSPWHKFVSPSVILAAIALMACAPLVLDLYSLAQLNRIGALSLLGVSVVVLSVCGLSSLGQVAPFAVGGYLTYILSDADMVVGPILLVASAVAAGVFNAVIGLFVVRVRGVIFLMVTLAVGVLTAEAAGQWKNVTGGTDGTGYMEATLPYWGGEPLVADAEVYWYIFTVVVVMMLITAAILRSAPGKVLQGIRENELRMRASGHRVTGVLLMAYTGAGVLGGIAGSLYATSQRFMSPSDVGFTVAAMMLIAVLIGGSYSVVGALVGVAVVTATRFWIAPPGESDLWLGVLLMICMYLLPNGAVGGLLETKRRVLNSETYSKARKRMTRFERDGQEGES